MKNTARFKHIGYAMHRLPNLSMSEWFRYLQYADDLKAKAQESSYLSRRALAAKHYFDRPAIRESIFLASVPFYTRLCSWNWNPNDKYGAKMLAAFERYLNRMCFRSTPFGTFSTVGYATINDGGNWEKLESGPESTIIEKSIKLDGKALGALARRLRGRAGEALKYRLNPSIYRIGTKFRYFDIKSNAGSAREYEIAEIDYHPVLDAVFKLIRFTPLDLEELQVAIAPLAHENDLDGKSLVEDLIASKIFVPSLHPDPLNLDPTGSLLNVASQYLEGDRDFQKISETLYSFGSAGRESETTIEKYQYWADGFQNFVDSKAGDQLLHVDAFRNEFDPEIPAKVVQEVVDDFSFLYSRLGVRNSVLDTFCETFSKTYGRKAVSLLQALDPESGVGFGPSLDAVHLPSKLGIKRPNRSFSSPNLSALDRVIAKKLENDPTLLIGEQITLTAEDFDDLSIPKIEKYPTNLHLLLNFPRGKKDSTESTRLRVLKGFSLSGAVSWSARFTHANTKLLCEMKDFAARVQEAAEEDVIHAEISYCADPKAINVMSRPQVWKYRLNLAEMSDSPSEFEIPISDVYVTVNGREVELWSMSLSKRIIPHLTSAHNYKNAKHLIAYRFLGAIEQHNTSLAQIAWGGGFSSFGFKPRVVFNDLIICPATWTFSNQRLKKITKRNHGSALDSLRELLQSAKCPSFVEIEEGDNTLLVDITDEFQLAQVLRVVKKGFGLTINEVLDDFPEIKHDGSRSTWSHEIVLPLVINERPKMERPGQQGLSRFDVDLQKVPMSQVVYARIYGSAETLDREVLPAIRDFIDESYRADEISKWFFIRYGEGGWHIRLRLFAKETRYLSVIDRLITVLDSLQSQEKISKFDFAQYEREIVRYGGTDCIDANEDLFFIDSSLYMDLMAAENSLNHDAPRWMAGIILIDGLLRDFKFTTQQKLAVVSPMAESFKTEFSLSGKQSEALGQEYRKNAKLLMQLLKREGDMPVWATNIIDKLASVSIRRQQLCSRLISQTSSIDRRERDILEGQIHMLCNRLFHVDGREHEVLLYDFMARAYRTLGSLESLRQ